MLTLSAPAGMQFSTLDWSARVRRTDCNYEIEVAATGPARAVALTKTVAGKRCPRRGRAQTSGLVGDGSRGIAGTDRIVVRVLCKAGRGSAARPAGPTSSSLGRLEAKVQDVQAPTVTITGGDLVSGRWVRGNQPVTYVANDGAGVRRLRCFSAAPMPGEQGPALRQLRTRPLSRADRIRSPRDTDQARDGTHQAVVVATDAAGNSGLSVRPVLARVDNTAPLQVPISAQGGEAWRSSNAFGATWSNPRGRGCRADRRRHLPDLPRRRRLPDAADQHQQHDRPVIRTGPRSGRVEAPDVAARPGRQRRGTERFESGDPAV